MFCSPAKGKGPVEANAAASPRTELNKVSWNEAENESGAGHFLRGNNNSKAGIGIIFFCKEKLGNNPQRFTDSMSEENWRDKSRCICYIKDSSLEMNI